MALTLGGATTDRIRVSDAASIRTLAAYTWAAWLLPTNFTANRYIASKGGTVRGFRINTTGGVMRLQQGRGATNCNYITNTNPLTLNAWQFACATYDESATPAAHIYRGTMNNILTECGYSTSADGTGATTTDSGLNLDIGNDGGASPVGAFQGRIGVLLLFNRALSLAELRSLQFDPRVLSGCVGYWQLGFNGTGSQPDYSGNGNAGTVTGATVVDHVPLGAPWGSMQRTAFVVAATSQSYSDASQAAIGALIRQLGTTTRSGGLLAAGGVGGRMVATATRFLALVSVIGARSQSAASLAKLATEQGTVGATALKAATIAKAATEAGAVGAASGEAATTSRASGQQGTAGASARVPAAKAHSGALAGSIGATDRVALARAVAVALSGAAGPLGSAASTRAALAALRGQAGTRAQQAALRAAAAPLLGSVGCTSALLGTTLRRASQSAALGIAGQQMGGVPAPPLIEPFLVLGPSGRARTVGASGRALVAAGSDGRTKAVP